VNETVLVVDDEERIRSSLRGILSDEGFRVLDTGRAPEVMELIGRENPAVVLLDVWMPDIDGIELLRRIKSERPAVQVIMISGHANIQSAVAATKLGAADFIQKPFSVSGLLAAIARSAAEIFVEGAEARIRVCANPGCGLFFCDTSRTHRRRWCSMAVCGNRHKVASFARRRVS